MCYLHDAYLTSNTDILKYDPFLFVHHPSPSGWANLYIHLYEYNRIGMFRLYSIRNRKSNNNIALKWCKYFMSGYKAIYNDEHRLRLLFDKMVKLVTGVISFLAFLCEWKWYVDLFDLLYDGLAFLIWINPLYSATSTVGCQNWFAFILFFLFLLQVTRLRLFYAIIIRLFRVFFLPDFINFSIIRFYFALLLVVGRFAWWVFPLFFRPK